MTTLVIRHDGDIFWCEWKVAKNVGFIHRWPHKMNNNTFSPITICEGASVLKLACSSKNHLIQSHNAAFVLLHSVTPILPSLSFSLRSATWTKCTLTKSSFWRILLMYGLLLRALFIINKSRTKTIEFSGLFVVSPSILPSGFQCSADQSGDEYQHNKIWQIGLFTLMWRREMVPISSQFSFDCHRKHWLEEIGRASL